MSDLFVINLASVSDKSINRHSAAMDKSKEANCS